MFCKCCKCKPTNLLHVGTLSSKTERERSVIVIMGAQPDKSPGQSSCCSPSIALLRCAALCQCWVAYWLPPCGLAGQHWPVHNSAVSLRVGQLGLAGCWRGAAGGGRRHPKSGLCRLIGFHRSPLFRYRYRIPSTSAVLSHVPSSSRRATQ